MLLQRLCEYADRQLEVAPPGYKVQSIRYVVDLAQDAQYLGTVDTADPHQPNTRRGRAFTAPYLKRSGSKPPPILLTDLAGRTLNMPYNDKPDSWCEARHQEYLELVRDCAKRTGDQTMTALVSFLDTVDWRALSLPENFDAGNLLTFRVGGVFPFEVESVRRYWGNETGASEDAPTLNCIACGEIQPTLRIHPLKIKGIRSGNSSGTDLISANKEAFRSYGLDGSLIAPTCYACAWKYGNALNALLSDDESHIRIGAVEYIFWTADKVAFRPGSLLSAPDPAEVREMLDAARTGKASAVALSDTAFYALGLSGSGARIAVRSWIDTTVGSAQASIARYFALQDIVDTSGDVGDPLPIWRLAGATVRDPRKDTVAPGVSDALFELALAGRRLPEDVLSRAIQRCRAGQGVSRERAALIKMAIGSELGWSRERMDAMHGLDTTNQDAAYLCGRLLAVLDAIQRRAISANATVVDKFYGSASSAPASVFGNLLDNAQNHLAKLRKSPATRGASIALDARLMEVMEGLDAFPRTLTMPQQAMFALGFYHQRAADRRAALDRREAQEDGNASPTEPSEPTN